MNVQITKHTRPPCTHSILRIRSCVFIPMAITPITPCPTVCKCPHSVCCSSFVPASVSLSRELLCPFLCSPYFPRFPFHKVPSFHCPFDVRAPRIDTCRSSLCMVLLLGYRATKPLVPYPQIRTILDPPECSYVSDHNSFRAYALIIS